MCEKKNVGILLFPDVEVLDFAGPFEVFSVTGKREGEGFFRVFTIGESLTPIKTVNGLSVNPDYKINDTPPIDILIIPGGAGSRAVLKKETILEWVRQKAEQAEMVLSVCTGALILAQAGLLENMGATTHRSCLELLKEMAPNTRILQEERFVDNGKYIVAAGISAGIDMSLYVVARLSGPDQAKETAYYMEYDYKS
ncbi:MAG: DJ-1/PfpI family protein [Syntrophomonadaceae bacterium]|jgi:transcriptional regulator GlxA family with amidase domain|nr:DJ-1/PfpI family protein [Syntrophomonadaceae bacterium]